jgi:hypothetical protein
VGIPYDQLPERVKALIVEEREALHRRQEQGLVMDGALPSAPKRSKLERDLHKEVYNELNRRRPKVWCVDSRMDRPTTQRKGVPDFLCSVNGKFLAIELKRPGEKPTDDQQRELNEVTLSGGIACVAFSIEQVISVLNELLK